MLSKIIKMAGLVVALIIISQLFHKPSPNPTRPSTPGVMAASPTPAGNATRAEAHICRTRIQFDAQIIDQRWMLRLELPQRMTLRDMSNSGNETLVYTPVVEENGQLVGQSDKGIVLRYVPAIREIRIYRRDDTVHVASGRCD